MVSRAKPPWLAHPHPPKSHLADSIAKAKGGNGGGGNKTFMAQIIPVYGFGLLMYILYILFKISSTGSGQRPKPRARCGGSRAGSVKCKITDYELAQLQAKLRETEVVMKQIASKMGHGSDKFPTSEQDENPLRQFKDFTKVLKERNFIEGIGPEKEAEESDSKEHSDGAAHWSACYRCTRVGRAHQRFPIDTSEQEANLLRQLKEITRVIKEQNIIEGIGPEKEPEGSHHQDHSDGYGGETEHSRCSCGHDSNYSKSSQRSAEEPETELDPCLFNETAENKTGQDEDSERGAQIGRCARGAGGDREDLHREDWKGLAREPGVTPEEDGTASGEDHCHAGDRMGDDSRISEPQHMTTHRAGALRKRNKMAVE